MLANKRWIEFTAAILGNVGGTIKLLTGIINWRWVDTSQMGKLKGWCVTLCDLVVKIPRSPQRLLSPAPAAAAVCDRCRPDTTETEIIFHTGVGREVKGE